MAKLSADEEKVLQRLMRKREAPDTPSNRTLNISIDLGDNAQVERAQRLGLLDMFDEEEEAGGGEEEEPERDGYFGKRAS